MLSLSDAWLSTISLILTGVSIPIYSISLDRFRKLDVLLLQASRTLLVSGFLINLMIFHSTLGLTASLLGGLSLVIGVMKQARDVETLGASLAFILLFIDRFTGPVASIYYLLSLTVSVLIVFSILGYSEKRKIADHRLKTLSPKT